MKKASVKFIALLLCFSILFTGGVFGASASNAEKAQGNIGSSITKVFYNALNTFCEAVVSTICKVYPNPVTWDSLDNYNSDDAGFMKGRENYQTKAKEEAKWSLGYASLSLVPEDFEEGKYYIGRDLTVRKAKGVYDDQKIRVTAIDDKSGEGAVVIGAVDALGVTSTDVRAIRKAVLDYCQKEGIKVSSINIMATHSHSALDTQGVSTEFFKKLFTSVFLNLSGTQKLPGLETAEAFKSFFIFQSVEAVKSALSNMEEGNLYFSEVDTSSVMKDKRDLISKEDLQKTPVLHFVPDNSSSVGTYIADISCHPTAVSASNGYVTGDYIYYLEKYIKEQTGDNTLMVAGALGQVSRDITVSKDGLDEYTAIGAEADALGRAFGSLILSADFQNALEPILNAAHKEIFIEPENSVLVLACEINLVNNKLYYDGGISKKYYLPSEIGYLEFGNKVGFALFPGELYPEVFLGNAITGEVSWNGEKWQYGNLQNEVEGVKTYAVSLSNDALGYAVTDNNFAFMGHIIGDGIADEVLSIGGHIGSLYADSYLKLIEEMK